MLDLKAKLAAAGLVSAADIAAAERKPGPAGPRSTGPRGHDPKASPARGNPQPKPQQKPQQKPRPLLDIAALQRGNKGEAYDAIRRVVEQQRLDPAHGIPGEHAEPFHFSTATGQLSRLTLEPAARDALTDGHAGLIAFMSHHGLAHCVVPRPLAESVHAIFPLWLRVLKDHPGAGQSAPRPEPAATQQASAAPPELKPEPRPEPEPEPEPDDPGA